MLLRSSGPHPIPATPLEPQVLVSPEDHGLWVILLRKSQLDAELLLGLGDAEEGRGSRWEARSSSQLLAPPATEPQCVLLQSTGHFWATSVEALPGRWDPAALWPHLGLPSSFRHRSLTTAQVSTSMCSRHLCPRGTCHLGDPEMSQDKRHI